MKVLTLDASEKLLRSFLPIAKSKLVKSVNHAKSVAKSFGYPVVLKLVSSKVIHKTEFKGVQIVYTEQQLENAFVSFQKTAKQKRLPLKGILVQELVKGKELILGIKRDETFGHVILLGTGGILVELLKDVSFRSCPINEKEALSMIDDLSAKQLLFGFRGEKPVNIKLLVNSLVKLSNLPKKYPKLEELDVNPLIINEKEAKVVDARIVLK